MIWIGLILLAILGVLLWIALELMLIRTNMIAQLQHLSYGLRDDDGWRLSRLNEHASAVRSVLERREQAETRARRGVDPY